MTEKRTNTPDELVPVGGSAPPSWLAEYSGDEDTSTEGMDEYQILPRIKLIQGTTDDDLKDAMGGEGAACLVPGNMLICSKAESFNFVPCFFWTEYWFMSDIDDKDSNTIMEREHDRASELAQKCRDKDRRQEEYKDEGGKTWKGRNVEVLLFAVVITTKGHSLQGIGCVLTFMKGEFGIGRNLTNAIKLRKIIVDGQPVQVPLWSTQWEASIGRRNDGPKKKWWGFDVVPAEEPSIDKGDAPIYKELHEKWKQLHQDRNLGADTSDLDKEKEEQPTSTKM